MAQSGTKIDMDALNAGIDRVLRYDTSRKPDRKQQRQQRQSKPTASTRNRRPKRRTR